MKRWIAAFGLTCLAACSKPDLGGGPGLYGMEKDDAKFEVLIPVPGQDPTVTRIEELRAAAGAQQSGFEYVQVCIDNTKGSKTLDMPILTLVTEENQQRESLTLGETAEKWQGPGLDEAKRSSLNELIAQEKQQSVVAPGQKACGIQMFEKPLPERFEKLQASFGKVIQNTTVQAFALKQIR